MFGTSGIRGPVGETVTAELALSVGRAIASEGYERVVVGRDVRESGEVLQDALSAGLRECGADVIDLGIVSTPTLARAVKWRDADAGAVITASHNPPEDNGVKLWTPSGKAFGPERRDGIEERLTSGEYDLVPWDGVGRSVCDERAEARHGEALVSDLGVLDGTESFSVVVDLGNGTGRVTARTLADAGARVRTLNGHRDGAFPGRPSEPNAASLADLAATVSATDADLGIAHDGDADRTMAVDETGSFVPKDVLFALFARDAVDGGESRQPPRVAAPVDTSLTVADAVEDAGGTITTTRVGDVFVAERATSPNVVFGGEPSGAWIWPEETLCPDGPLAACRLASMVAESGPLSALVDEVDTYPIRRRSVEVDDPSRVVGRIEAVAGKRYDSADIDTLDGVRIDERDGWILLRASGTQPLVRLTAEARTEDRADELLGTAESLLEVAGTEST